MDALARGLRNAAALKKSGLLDELVSDRYASWHAKGGLGEKITKGKVGHRVCCFILIVIAS
jgi:xylose isomerase